MTPGLRANWRVPARTGVSSRPSGWAPARGERLAMPVIRNGAEVLVKIAESCHASIVSRRPDRRSAQLPVRTAIRLCAVASLHADSRLRLMLDHELVALNHGTIRPRSRAPLTPFASAPQHPSATPSPQEQWYVLRTISDDFRRKIVDFGPKATPALQRKGPCSRSIALRAEQCLLLAAGQPVRATVAEET